MALREVYEKCENFYEKARRHPKFWIGFGILLAVILLIWLPPWRVSHFEINNATIEADLENQYRATIAQILGGVAIGITLYYTWRRITIADNNLKVSQDNLKVSQEGQITERFTRAIDQLGNEKLEIRLGGIYALERIANESEKDYWPIMEILTAYVRKNSPVKTDSPKLDTKVNPDIQAILTTIGRSQIPSGMEPKRLNLQETYLQKADFREANLQWVNLSFAHLENANFVNTNLKGAYLEGTHLENTLLLGANLEEADLKGAHLKKADLKRANLNKTDLSKADLGEANLCVANLEGADFKMANLQGADFRGAILKGAKNLTIDQLSTVRILYLANLDKDLEIPLKEKYPALFEEPDE